jgi:hypothetical protein
LKFKPDLSTRAPNRMSVTSLKGDPAAKKLAAFSVAQNVANGPKRHFARRGGAIANGAKADMTGMRQFGRLRPKADIHRQDRLGD